MAMNRVPSNTTLPEPLKKVAQEYCDRIGKTLTALQQELLEARLKEEGINPYPKLLPAVHYGLALAGAL